MRTLFSYYATARSTQCTSQTLPQMPVITSIDLVGKIHVGNWLHCTRLAASLTFCAVRVPTQQSWPFPHLAWAVNGMVSQILRQPAVRALVCLPWITTFGASRCQSLKGNPGFWMWMISVGTAKLKQPVSGQKTDFECWLFSRQGSQSCQR